MSKSDNDSSEVEDNEIQFEQVDEEVFEMEEETLVFEQSIEEKNQDEEANKIPKTCR